MLDKFSPSASSHSLKLRAELYRNIRQFFFTKGVLEVELPTLSSSFVSDPFIEPIVAQCFGRSYYLQSSPEYAMKRLLASLNESIYSLGKAYRHNEQSARHNPEFTLLEWYKLGFDEHQLMDELVELLQGVLPPQKVTKITYRQWFENRFKIDPHWVSSADLLALLQEHVTIDPQGLTPNDCLDLLVTHVLEPELSKGLVFVYDYPKAQAALARVRVDETGQQVARRFELFLDGMELANGYWELTDAEEQGARFESDLAVRTQQGLPIYPLDKQLLTALKAGLPECAGVALGVDRLLMKMMKAEHIEQVLAFGFTRV